MATRRLSRSIIERGKAGYDKNERRKQIQKSRRQARDFCQKYIDEDSIELPEHDGFYYYRGFADKFGTLKRFLRSHIGVPWDIVYSKLCRIKSTKTVQGWHFLEHAKGMVYTENEAKVRRVNWGFYLENGILKEFSRKRDRYRWNKKLLKRYEDWIGANRKIKLVGSKYFWFVKTNQIEYSQEFLALHYRTSSGNAIPANLWSWRQHLPLTRQEVGYMEWLKAKDDRIWKRLVTGA